MASTCSAHADTAGAFSDRSALIESTPREHALVVYSTIALYQFPRESRQRYKARMADRT